MFTYKFHGCIYSDNPTYYSWDDKKMFPKYDEIKGTEKEVTIQAESLADAEKYFKRNFPERFQGSAIVCQDHTEFQMNAIPCGEYGRGNYETIEDRIRWALSTI